MSLATLVAGSTSVVILLTNVPTARHNSSISDSRETKANWSSSHTTSMATGISIFASIRRGLSSNSIPSSAPSIRSGPHQNILVLEYFGGAR